MKNRLFLWRRAVRFWWQRRTRGWDDSELWSLDYTIAKFTLPRLKGFREQTCGVPYGLTREEWLAKIDDMIYAMEFIVDEEKMFNDERTTQGLNAFHEYFQALWW